MNYRKEIDGLRALAIIAVILYHFFPTWLPSGFLGVDVFFVISGFVITLHLRSRPECGFLPYIVEFYVRRIRRIVPALLFCVVVTTMFTVLFITRPPLDIFLTGATAMLGLSNNYLLFQSYDYFSLLAQLNPFMQTWSLGVEEQFYFLFPALLALAGFSQKKIPTGPKRVGILLGILSLASLFFYFYQMHKSPQKAFYLMLARFWELGLGALLAIHNASGVITNYCQKTLSIILLLILIGLFFTPKYLQIPSTVAISLVTTGLLFNLRPKVTAYRILAYRPIVFIGLISYSLYLWHWSILILVKMVIGVTPLTIPFLLIGIVLVSIFSYVVIEKPFRFGHWSVSNATILGSGIVITVVTAITLSFAYYFGANYNNNLPNLLGIPAVEAWKPAQCEGKKNIAILSNPFETCLQAHRTVAQPHALYLVGDSHAAQFVPMMELALKESAFEIRFINAENEADFPLAFIKAENLQVASLNYILTDSRPGDIIVITFHRGQLNAEWDMHIPLTEATEDNQQTIRMGANLERYVKLFLSQNIRVILIKDTPLMNSVTTSSSCFMQMKLFGQNVCRVSKIQDLHTRIRQDRLFDRLATHANVYLWDPLPLVYGQSDDFDVVDAKGRYLMRDWNHISFYQSTLLAENFRHFLKMIMIPANDK